MPDYTLYIFGRTGHFVREIEMDCADEKVAIALAQQWVDAYDVELWQLDRPVARFDAAPKDLAASSGPSLASDGCDRAADSNDMHSLAR
jgi:hypothetical protein